MYSIQHSFILKAITAKNPSWALTNIRYTGIPPLNRACNIFSSPNSRTGHSFWPGYHYCLETLKTQV